MRRFVPVACVVLVVALVAVMLAIYASGDDADAPTSVSEPTHFSPTARAGSVLDVTCDEGDADPVPSDRLGELPLEEAAARIEELLGRPIPAPAPPSSGWTVKAQRIPLITVPYEEPIEGFEYHSADQDGGALVYSDGEQTAVSVIYQITQNCDDFSSETVGVSTGASSVDVIYETMAGGRTLVRNDDERSFTFEGIKGMFDLPQTPGLYVTVIIEWDEATAPEEDVMIAELENWARAILIAADERR